LLTFEHWESRRDYENTHSNHYFISGKDAESLPKQELFEKMLHNEQLEIKQQSLHENGLLSILDPDASSPNYQISEKGKLFIYVVAEESGHVD